VPPTLQTREIDEISKKLKERESGATDFSYKSPRSEHDLSFTEAAESCQGGMVTFEGL